MDGTAALVPGRPLLQGDVAWCRFPYGKKTKELHPVLILQPLESPGLSLPFVIVAGGTSVFGKNGRRLSTTSELHVVPSDPEFSDTNLRHATKFNFDESTVLILPFSTKEFRLPDGEGCPVIGHLKLTTPRMKARLNVVSHAIGGLDQLLAKKIKEHNSALEL